MFKGVGSTCYSDSNGLALPSKYGVSLQAKLGHSWHALNLKIIENMRIVSLAPFLTETIFRLGMGENLVGVSHRCDYPAEVLALPKLTRAIPQGSGFNRSTLTVLEQALNLDIIDLAAIQSLAPELIVTRDISATHGITLLELRELVKVEFGEQCSIATFDPKTFGEILESFEALGRVLGREGAGLELAARCRAQVSDWASNFYDRTRGKKVTFLCGTEPLVLAGLWIPEMIGMTSAVSQHKLTGGKHLKIEWKQVLEFAPDVIIIAPGGLSLNAAMKRLKYFEGLSDWENIPAVKRGEVFFCDGIKNFNRPSPRIMDSMGILISAIAGIESGYITERDSFQRLRWVEMHRDKDSSPSSS